jgi:hypothetical protein
MQDFTKFGFSLSLILLNLALPQVIQQQSDHSTLACAVSSLTPLDDSYGKTVVSSPDQTKHIRLHQDGSFQVFEGKKLVGVLTYDAEANVRVGWSPDSTQFFITYSDAGSAGGYHGHLFRISETRGIMENRLPQIAFEDFKLQHYCRTRGNNLYVVGWTPDSRQALIVAEVYPASDCGKEMGLLEGYLMNVSLQKIIRRYSQDETTTITKACRASGTVEIQQP